MSRESYIRGFTRCAMVNGVDPEWLAKVASDAGNTNIVRDMDWDIVRHERGDASDIPTMADSIPKVPEAPRKPTLIQNPGKLGVEANKRMESQYREAVEKFRKAIADRNDALAKRRRAIMENARGDSRSAEDLAAWSLYGVPNLAHEISRGSVPNVKYNFDSGTNALTEVRRKLWGAEADSFPPVIEVLKNLRPSARKNTSLMRSRPSVVMEPRHDIVKSVQSAIK